MSAHDDLERRLTDHYEREAPARAPRWVLEESLATIAATGQRRTILGRPWKALGMTSPVARIVQLGAATIAVVVVLVAGGMLAGTAGPGPAGSGLVAPSVAPTPSPDYCADLEPGSTYERPVGDLVLAATVPSPADGRWNGFRDGFRLERAFCLQSGPAYIQAGIIGAAWGDPCVRPGTKVTVDTPADAVDTLASQTAVARTGRSELTIDGYPATRIDVAIPKDYGIGSCTDEAVQLLDGFDGLDAGTTGSVYVVDVDGEALGIVVYRREDVLGLAREVGALVSGLRIDRAR